MANTRGNLVKNLNEKQKKAWNTVKNSYGVGDSDLLDFYASIDFTEFITRCCGDTLTIRVYTNGMITER